MFTGLSAFPLTPLVDDELDEAAFSRLVRRARDAGVDSIAALGSTGSYAYLDRDERALAVRIAVENAGQVPVLAGIGALRTRDAVQFAEDAQTAGAAGVLLAPLTYQRLDADDVFGLFRDVCANLSVPLIVYDNPATTHFAFTDDLYARVTALPGVASIKIPGLPGDPSDAPARVRTIRSLIPAGVTIGIAGDAYGALGLSAGCDGWYSAIAGVLPEMAVRIVDLIRAGESEAALAESERLRPLWDLFAEHGSVRVCAAIAEHYGLARRSSLPLPVRGLEEQHRERIVGVLERLGLGPSWLASTGTTGIYIGL